MSPLEVAHRLRITREFLASLKEPLSLAGIRSLCMQLEDMEAALLEITPVDYPAVQAQDTILTEAPGSATLDTMTIGTDRGAAISAGHRAGRPREATIRHLLKQTGLGSIAQVAVAIGVSPSMLSRVIAGEKRLGAEKAAALQSLVAANEEKKKQTPG